MLSQEASDLLREDEDHVIRVIARTPRPDFEAETAEELDAVDRFVRERYGLTPNGSIYDLVDEFGAALARKLHEHEVRGDGLGTALALCIYATLGGRCPEVFAVVKHLRIGHVVQAVYLCLQFQQQLGVADVLAQRLRHCAAILEQAREHAPIGSKNRVLGVKDVEGRRAIVGVDDHLDAVPHVVDGVASEVEVPRIRKGFRNGKGVDHPRQPTIAPTTM